MTVISLANQKGGCGKTTTTRNLASALKEKGKKVLVVDLDQQGNLTDYCGVNSDGLESSIHTVFESYIDMYGTPLSLKPQIYEVDPGLDLVPANEELSSLDIDLINAFQREEILKKMLEPVRSDYDYILLDCPPALSLLVVNALVASDSLIVVLQADYLATKGVKRLLKLATAVKNRLNPTLGVDGIVLTMADMRTSHTKTMIDRTRSNFNDKLLVFDTVIKMYTGIKDTPIQGKSILDVEPKSTSAQSFRDLADELDTIHNGAQHG